MNNKEIKNKTTSEEVVELKSNPLFDPHLGFDKTLEFVPINEF